jgi:dihydrofolate reductase
VRPRCSVFIATSLDGFIARPDGAIDWLSIVEQPGEDYGYAAFFETVDALVIGRKTYETVLRFETWPYAGKRCVVLTHDPPTSRHGEEFFDGVPGDLIERLSRDGVKRVYVDGGNVIQQFLAAGLVDDITLSVVPVLLGEGIRLFGPTSKDVRLDLVRSRSFASGLVQNEYRVVPVDDAHRKRVLDELTAEAEKHGLGY